MLYLFISKLTHKQRGKTSHLSLCTYFMVVFKSTDSLKTSLLQVMIFFHGHQTHLNCTRSIDSTSQLLQWAFLCHVFGKKVFQQRKWSTKLVCPKLHGSLTLSSIQTTAVTSHFPQYGSKRCTQDANLDCLALPRNCCFFSLFMEESWVHFCNFYSERFRKH